MFNANFNSIFISAYLLTTSSFAHPQQRKPLRPPADEPSAEHCVRASQPAGRARRDLATSTSTACRRRCGTCVINEKVNTVF